MKNQFKQFLKSCPVVAILRGITEVELFPVCDALFESGIKILEIPLNTPDACNLIASAVRHCGNHQLVGAGTVLSVEDVHAVKDSGGAFIISPDTNAAVIGETKKLEMLSIPGFFTATEGFAAIRAGADFLKLFPASIGPGYIRDLKAVIKTPILAVGGVNAGNIPAFLQVCCGVGVGSALYKPGKTLLQITEDARKITEAAGKI